MNRPKLRNAWLPLVLLLVGLNRGEAANAQAIDRVEEDWELVLLQPDLVASGPQITTTMSPEGDNDMTFSAFNLNYRDYPFRAGGLQVAAWASGTLIAAPDSQKTAPCALYGEKITWTQRLRVSAGYAYYDIINGNSTTWGTFGQGNNLSLAYPTYLGDLSKYTPQVSTENSGVGWQSNLVSSMTLVEVRYYSGNNLVTRDTAPRPINIRGQ